MHEDHLDTAQLTRLSYHYYLKFLLFFQSTPLGSLNGGIEIILSNKMKRRLGSADLYSRQIHLNARYFNNKPRLLPYTIFHEMNHVWLYDCYKDPSHTRSFYQKMSEFESTGLDVDPDVHIHRRMAPERPFVYTCPSCSYRWFMNKKLRRKTMCANCEPKGKFYLKPLLTRPNSTTEL